LEAPRPFARSGWRRSARAQHRQPARASQVSQRGGNTGSHTAKCRRPERHLTARSRVALRAARVDDGPGTPMPNQSTTARDVILREAIRTGVRRFVVGFAKRHRVDGLPPGPAATATVHDMVHNLVQGALVGILGLPARPHKLASTGRSVRAKGRTPRRPRKRGQNYVSNFVQASEPDPDDRRLEKLKKFVSEG
jgi:hypothetical protein